MILLKLRFAQCLAATTAKEPVDESEGEEDGGGAEVVVPPLGIVEMGEVPLFLCSVICNTRMDFSL